MCRNVPPVWFNNPAVLSALRDYRRHHRHERDRHRFHWGAEPGLFLENCLRTMLSKASTAGWSRLGFNPMSIDVQCRERTFL
jgi:hypothetical protein